MVRTILITGCSDGGLGAALAVAFHRQGDRVLATARNPKKMTSLKSLGIETLSLDVLSAESVKVCVAEVSALTGGSLDILINNAGSGYSVPMVEAEISEVEKLFDLNVWSIIRTTRHFVPLLRNSKTGALLVNNTSGNSIMPMPFQGPYNASKAAAAMVTQNLRLELQAFGIKVIDLKTGAVKSHFHENSTTRVNPVLPENSLYTPAKEKMESIFRGEININLMPAEEYAKRVVNDLSKDNPPLIIWRGDSATKAWLASFAPLGFTDGLLKKISGLDVVEQILKAKVGKKIE